MTHKQTAELHGVSVSTIRRYKREGIDINDSAEVKQHIRSKRSMPPAMTSKASAVVSTLNADSTDDELLAALKSSPDYATSRHISSIIKGIRDLKQIAIIDKSYVPADEVTHDMVRIAHAVKTGLHQLGSELPPVLEGLTAPKMQKAIKRATDRIVLALHNHESEWYDMPEG